MSGTRFRETQSQPSLLVDHRTVRIDGHSVGLAVSLANSFVFYTTDDHLQELDGQRFNSMADLYTAVKATIPDAVEAGIAA